MIASGRPDRSVAPARDRARIGLYLGVTPNAGGMFQYAQSMLEAFDAMHGKMTDVVVAYGDDSWSPLLKRFSLPYVRLRHWRRGDLISRALLASLLPASTARRLSSMFNPLARDLDALGCSLWVFPAQDALSWQIKGATVTTIHDLMHRYERQFPEAGSWWRYRLREHRFRNLAGAANAVLVDSEMGKHHVIESYGAPANRIFALPYVPPSYILAANGTEEEVAQRYNLPPKFLFYPAQFWPHKNHLRLIEALAQARRCCPDMTLVLSGGPRHDHDKVKARVYALGLQDAVHFIGYVPDLALAAIYRRARGLVMPTFFGPTNIPPLEAMSCGCPILISGIYGMPEQCADAALYFDPSATAEIRDAMLQLWRDESTYARLAENGRKRSASWRQADFNDRLTAVLGQVLQQMPAPVAAGLGLST